MRRTTYYLSVFLLLAPVLATSSATAEEASKISLRTVVELALANNLNLQLKKEEVYAAEGAALATEGKFDILMKGNAGLLNQQKTPILAGGADRENTRQWNAETSKLFTSGTTISLSLNNTRYDSNAYGLLFNPSYTSGLTLGLRQSLLKGFGEETQTLATKASQKQLQAATFQVASEAANLAAEVKRSYWSLVYAWQNTEVQKLSLVLAQKTLKETEINIKSGKLAEVEIYQPQAEVARREELLIAVEREIGTAEDVLKLLINSKDWLTAFEPTDAPNTSQVKLNPETILNNALNNRPDIKTADLLVEAARLDEARAKDNTLPELSLIGGVGLAGSDGNYGDSVDNSVTSPDNLWQVGLAFSIPLENRTAEGSYRQAKAVFAHSQTRAELLRQQIHRNVRTTIRDIQLAIKALEATKKTSFASLKRLEAEQTKFSSGRATTLDVLIAQEAYSQALKQQNLTEINYANSLVELDRIQGLITVPTAP